MTAGWLIITLALVATSLVIQFIMGCGFPSAAGREPAGVAAGEAVGQRRLWCGKSTRSGSFSAPTAVWE